MTHRVASLLACNALAAALTLVAPAAYSHHPIGAKFDEAKVVTYSGRVTAIAWNNPHAHVFFNVKQADGSEVNWATELPSAVELDWSGWTPQSLKTGDEITVTGPVARNGSHQLWGTTVKRGNDALFSVSDDVFEKQKTAVSGATPRWPDNQPRLGPAQGETGYWALPGKTTLMEDGVNVAADVNGLLSNIADASKVAPFQDWARDLYTLRQTSKLKDDPMFLNCIPPSGPRQFQLPFGLQFVEERERGRIFVLLSGGNGNWRLIYTDGRTQIGQLSGNDDNPLFYGRSLAKWEGDVLTVTTTGFNEAFWFSNGGLPHTRQLQLTERFTRKDKGTLHYEVTINDPGAYTRPWTSSWDLQWIQGKELPEYYCQDNRQ